MPSRMFWGVTGIALVIRVAHILVMADPDSNPLFAHPIMDNAMHVQWAQSLLAGTWPGSEPFFRAPLYIYFLAGLHALFGPENRLVIQLVHAVISACGAGLVALCAARCFGHRAGWLAGVMFATLWTSIYFAGELLIVTLTTTLNLLMLWLLLRDDEREVQSQPAYTWLFVGIVWGLSAIARPNVLILAPVVGWYLFRYRGLGWRWRSWVWLLIGLALPIVPVTLHNTIRGQDAVLIASQGGVNFYIGNNREADGRTAVVPGTSPTWLGGYEDAIALARQETGNRDLKPSGVDRHFLGKGIRFWFAEPVQAIRLYLHKLRLLVASGERSNNKNIYFWRDRSRILRWPVWLGWTVVLVLAVFGFFRRDLLASRRFLLLGMTAAYAISVYLFFVNARFRLPIAAYMTLAAGGGLDRLVEAVRNRHWPDSRWAWVVAATLLVFSVVPDQIKFSEDKIQADPFSWYSVGNAYAAAGRHQDARLAYQKAIDISKQYPQRHFTWIQEGVYTGLSTVLIQLDEPQLAARALTEFLRLDPYAWQARVTLGDLLLQAGQVDDAAAQFEVVLRNDPDHYGAKMGYAWILLYQGEPGAALRRFQDLQRRQSESRALFGAGLCLIELGRLSEAATMFEKVLQLDPAYWQALGNLAGIYARTGQDEKAREAYRQLLTINPRDEQALQWLREHGDQ